MFSWSFESKLAEFIVPLENFKQLNSYVKRILNFEYVQFDGLHPEII